jgi:hypothetical protein
MEALIDQRLKATETCIVCTEPFSSTHTPVALPCNHVFGHACIKKWLRDGRGNTQSCPYCRHAIISSAISTASNEEFTPESVWTALSALPQSHFATLTKHTWAAVQTQWRGRMSADFSISELTDGIVLPALRETCAVYGSSPFIDALIFVESAWTSLKRAGRSGPLTGLTIPFVRLARMMAEASGVLPKWLTSVERVNVLLWNANASLGLGSENIDWDTMMTAATLSPTSSHLFPLLHLYTMLISQNIAHSPTPEPFPTCRHEVINLIVERCCRKIGARWTGRPGNEFKERLLYVFVELRRHQCEEGKMSLRGHAGEENVVRGLWGMAVWKGGDSASRKA